MKILMLFKRWKGGVGTVINGITNELRKRGHEVDTISREDDWNINSLSLLEVRKKVKEIGDKYDIIYTHDWTLALPLLLPYPIFKDKHYCLFHGHNPTKVMFQSMVGKYMGKNLLVVGDSLKERFPKATLNYNGVDLSKFKDLGKERTHLGWIERSYDLIEKKAVERLAEEMKLPLLIAKDIPHDKMNEFYNKCLYFISLPPKYTGFNVCWIEAIASGVPRNNIIYNNNGIGQKILNLNINDFTWEKNVDKLLEMWK